MSPTTATVWFYSKNHNFSVSFLIVFKTSHFSPPFHHHCIQFLVSTNTNANAKANEKIFHHLTLAGCLTKRHHFTNSLSLATGSLLAICHLIQTWKRNNSWDGVIVSPRLRFVHVSQDHIWEVGFPNFWQDKWVPWNSRVSWFWQFWSMLGFWSPSMVATSWR